MSDKPLDTPWDEMSAEEIAGMNTDELMERSIATEPLGVEGFLDTVIRTALVETMESIKMVQMTVLLADREDPRFEPMVQDMAMQLHAHLESVFQALVETGQRIGYKQGLEDGGA